MRWYVSQNGKTSGPFDEQRLEQLVHWGKVSSKAFICDSQWSAWIAIKRSAFAAALPPQSPESQAASHSARMVLGMVAALIVLLAGVLMAAA